MSFCTSKDLYGSWIGEGCTNWTFKSLPIDNKTNACYIHVKCPRTTSKYRKPEVFSEGYFIPSPDWWRLCGAYNEDGQLRFNDNCHNAKAQKVFDDKRKADEDRRKADEERRKAEEERKKKFDNFIALQRNKECLTYGAQNNNVHMGGDISCIRAGEKYIVGKDAQGKNLVVTFENERDINSNTRRVKVNYPEYECKGVVAYAGGVHQLIEGDCLQRMKVETFTPASAALPDGHLRLVDADLGNPLSFVCNISSGRNDCNLPQCMTSICK